MGGSSNKYQKNSRKHESLKGKIAKYSKRLRKYNHDKITFRYHSNLYDSTKFLDAFDIITGKIYNKSYSD